jgi:CRISPR-associated protein Cmr1
LPSLRNIFLAQIKPKDSSQSFTEQTTFNLKYDLRRLYASDQKLRHFIMGTVKNGRMAAKVKISRPYGDRVMRVWGWVPEQAGVYTSSWNRNKVVDAIHQHLKTNYSLQVWREMNSTRDTNTPSTSDAKVFLHSLLGLKEDGDGA